MNIHEYQAKEIFRYYGLVTPIGYPCFNLDEVKATIDKIANPISVIKAQIHAGGRGKAGGVCVAQDKQTAISFAERILGSQLVTHQTGSQGQCVKRLLVEAGADIAHEYYLSMVVDRVKQQVVVMASSEGGTDIETVAIQMPDKINKLWINPKDGINQSVIQKIESLVVAIGIDCHLPNATDQIVECIKKLYRLFVEKDASLVEINPLVVTTENSLLALDGKINFDDSAIFRHSDVEALRDIDEESETEIQAAKYDLSYIALEGNIGCMVNGAGLAMATMDIIQLYGGQPANFLDVGGGASAKKVSAAFKLMVAHDNVKAILINIFGGIMLCDVIAQGVLEAVKEVGLSLPLIVRLEGTNVEQGKAMLAQSGLSIITANTMSEAAQKAVTFVSS